MSPVAPDHFRIVVDLGKSGMSLAHYLACHDLPFAVVDTRENPPGLATLHTQYPQVEVHCGEFDTEFLYSVHELYISPGSSLHTPALMQVAAGGMRISDGIDLFARETKTPIIVITDSNAKSIVTTLVGETAVTADERVAAGSNLDTPALDLLTDDTELYVLGLSSFQLGTCGRFSTEVATVLNVNEDHMNHYDGTTDYHLVEHQIFRGTHQVVADRADALTRPLITSSVPCWSSSLDKPNFKAFGLAEEDDQKWLAFQFDKLLPVGEPKIRDARDYSNALAALALGHVVGLPFDAMLGALKTFSGLARRYQWVRGRQGVSYYDDSKTTNVDAALAAIEGLGADIDGKLVLLAGGDGRGADFHDLYEPVAHFCRAAVLLGRDVGLIAQALGNAVPLVRAATLDEAVRQAAELAHESDAVLSSPACASLDMFENFEERGRLLAKAVEELA